MPFDLVPTTIAQSADGLAQIRKLARRAISCMFFQGCTSLHEKRRRRIHQSQSDTPKLLIASRLRRQF